ncbi:MAG: hypothetical protein JWN93_2578 [Hyphomicrobiales bacterium]|nr:hypothetical protein [Hyphomicrobiales bacterium]
MLQFEVRFLKDICDSTGHPHTVVQRAVRVDAGTPDEALVMAQALFCASERISNWTIRASACDARPLAPVAAIAPPVRPAARPPRRASGPR